MKILLLFLTTLPLWAETPQPNPKAQLPATRQSTQDLIAALTKARWDHFHSEQYNPNFSLAPERKQVFALHDEEKWEEFITASEKWLEKMPVDLNVHYVRSFVFLRLGRFQEYGESFALYSGLIASVMSEGDGKSPETAFPVIHVKEEYSIFNELGLDLIEQSLVKGCDAMKCKDRNGDEVTLYFDVHKILQRQSEILKLPADK